MIRQLLNKILGAKRTVIGHPHRGRFDLVFKHSDPASYCFSLNDSMNDSELELNFHDLVKALAFVEHLVKYEHFDSLNRLQRQLTDELVAVSEPKTMLTDELAYQLRAIRGILSNIQDAMDKRDEKLEEARRGR